MTHTEITAMLEAATACDRGPWHASENGWMIASDDFRHDVVLKVTGDFEDDASRIAYARTLADRLNSAGETPTSLVPDDAVGGGGSHNINQETKP